MAIAEGFTAEDVATELCEAVGDSSEVTMNQAYNVINRALKIITRKGTWPFFKSEDQVITTVSDQEAYKIKSRVKLPKYLHMRDPARKLTMIDLRVLRELYPNNTETTGTPLYWRMKGYNQNTQSYELALWPIPDGVYSIYMDCDNNPALISNKNDDLRATGLPEEMIETLINIGIALLFEKKGDADYVGKLQIAMAMLEDDWFRLSGGHPDDNLGAKEHHGIGGPFQDPILPGSYNGV